MDCILEQICVFLNTKDFWGQLLSFWQIHKTFITKIRAPPTSNCTLSPLLKQYFSQEKPSKIFPHQVENLTNQFLFRRLSWLSCLYLLIIDALQVDTEDLSICSPGLNMNWICEGKVGTTGSLLPSNRLWCYTPNYCITAEFAQKEDSWSQYKWTERLASAG